MGIELELGLPPKVMRRILVLGTSLSTTAVPITPLMGFEMFAGLRAEIVEHTVGIVRPLSDWIWRERSRDCRAPRRSLHYPRVSAR